MTKAQILKRVERVKKEISTQRDNLRELIMELQDIEEAASDAVDCLEQAADSLSKYL